MANFIQQVVSGLGDGAIYASLALALVLIYRATHVINFAQGEMGMFSTYIAWALITSHGWSYWSAFALTLGVSFLGGVGIHQGVIRPLQRAGPHREAELGEAEEEREHDDAAGGDGERADVTLRDVHPADHPRGGGKRALEELQLRRPDP